jgi:hypothetical protein
MGVTIHFEGRLRDENSYERIADIARNYAARHHWQINRIVEAEVTLQRVQNDEPWDYVGPSRGLILRPHENCDPFRLEFDRDLYVQEFVKTQFAPIEIHFRVIELLRQLAPEFEILKVEDEGEFWDTEDASILSHRIQECMDFLEDELKNRPGATGPVRMPDGRIVDYISPE